MTHRTFTIDGVLFNVFDSHAGAQRFMSQQEGDYSVIVRGRAYSARRGETYLTINLNSEAKPEHGHIMAAAQAVAAEIDKLIAAEKALPPQRYEITLDEMIPVTQGDWDSAMRNRQVSYLAPESDPA